jgi:hypothetical protein
MRAIRDTPIDIPKGYEYFIDQTYYKIGLHEYVYMWNNGHWQHSQRTLKELMTPRKKITSGAKTGKGIDPNTKQRQALRAIEDYGPLDKANLARVTEMSEVSAGNAIKGLVEHGDLAYNKSTQLWGLAVETQCDLFTRASL